MRLKQKYFAIFILRTGHIKFDTRFLTPPPLTHNICIYIKDQNDDLSNGIDIRPI